MPNQSTPKLAPLPPVKVNTSDRAAMADLAKRATTSAMPIRSQELKGAAKR